MSASVFFPLHQQIVGAIGGCQLGRMRVRSMVWTGGLEAPAVEVADEVIDKPFGDPQALLDFCAKASVATVEFENIPLVTMRGVAEKINLFPSPEAVGICQNREKEKNFLREKSISCIRFWVVETLADLTTAMSELSDPSVLKTAVFGYDGKGQLKIEGTTLHLYGKSRAIGMRKMGHATILGTDALAKAEFLKTTWLQ